MKAESRDCWHLKLANKGKGADYTVDICPNACKENRIQVVFVKWNEELFVVMEVCSVCDSICGYKIMRKLPNLKMLERLGIGKRIEEIIEYVYDYNRKVQEEKCIGKKLDGEEHNN